MITVPQATEKIIRRSRYLSEAMMKDLINFSSLARVIQPEVEEIVMKEVTRASIVMAIKRYASSLKKKGVTPPLLTEAPDMIVRSNLTAFFVKNSTPLLSKLSQIEETSLEMQKKVLFSYGRAETVMLANKLTADSLRTLLKDETITRQFEDVSSITIHVPSDAVITPGILNLFVKSLSWEHIPLLTLLVTESELTIVLKKEDVHTAFGILRSLFEN